MSEHQTAEMAGIESIIDRLDELDDAIGDLSKTLMSILTVLDLQGKQLSRVLAAVTLDPNERGESKLEKLLEQLVLNGREHTAGLNRVVAALQDRSN